MRRMFSFSQVAQTVKYLPAMWEIWVWSLHWEGPLEKGMPPHSSILAWRIPRTDEPGRLQSVGSQSQTGLSNEHFHFIWYRHASHASTFIYQIRGLTLPCEGPNSKHFWKCRSYCSERGPLPGRKRGLLANTRKWIIPGDTCAEKARDFIGEGRPGRGQEGKGTQENCSVMWLPVLGFMGMGLFSGLSLISHSGSGSFLVTHALLRQDGRQWEGF